MFCVLLRLDTQDVDFRFLLFSAAQNEQHFDSFSRAKNGSVFHIGQGEKSGGKHKAKYGFAARGVGGPTVRSAAVLRPSFSGGGSGEVIVGDGSPVPSGRNQINRSGGRVPYSQPYGCK